MSDEADILSDRKCSVKAMLALYDRHKGEAFKNQDGQDFLSLTIGGKLRTYPLAAGVAELVKIAVKGGVVPSRHVRDELREDLSMRALAAQPLQTFVRMGQHKGAIYLDLCDDTWRAVRITAGAWEPVDDVPIRFVRGKSMKALPEPTRGGDITRLWTLVNVVDEHDRMLVLSWLVAALYPLGPCPGLAIVGSAGTCKTTALRFLRGLIDPSITDDRGLPKDEHSLAIAASRNWILSFDNLSGITSFLSDVLCRVSTGGSFANRTKYSDAEETTFKFQRPFLVNGIVDLAERPDFADRCINVRLSPIKVRRTEAEIGEEYERERPALLGCLLDALAHAMAAPKLTADLPRMADFAVLAMKAAPSLGFDPNAFLEMYKQNLDESGAAILDSDELVPVLQKLLDRNKGKWSGSPAELHTALLRATTNTQAVPKNARGVSAALNRLEELLAKRCGISITRDRSGKGRSLQLSTTK